MDNYRIRVTGDGSNALNEIQKINKAMDNIDKRDSGKGFKGIESALKGVSKLTDEINKSVDNASNKSVLSQSQLEKDQKNLQETLSTLRALRTEVDRATKQASKKGLTLDPQAQRSYKALGKEIDKIVQKRDMLGSKNVKPDASMRQAISDAKTFESRTQKANDALREQQRISKQLQRDNREATRAGRIVNDGVTNGRVTYNDRQRLNTALDKGRNVGDTPSYYQQQTNKIQSSIDTSGSAIKDNRAKIEAINKRPQSLENKERKAQLIDENEELEKLIRNLQKAKSRYEDMDTTAKKNFNATKTETGKDSFGTQAERGSFKGTMADRAPSIAMAGIGATGFALTSSYMKGDTINKNNRDDMFFRGNLMGETNYGQVRRDMFSQGIDAGYGYNADNLNAMAGQYLEVNGYQGKESMDEGLTQYQRAGRSLNIDNEAFQQSYTNIGKTGGMQGGEEIADFTNTFVGALDKSKMTHKSEQQLKALDSMATQMGTTRTLGAKDVNEMTALQGTMAESGLKTLQGEKGADAVNKITTGLQQGKSDPFALQSVGYGSELTGVSGIREAYSRLDEGATPENIKNVISQSGGGDMSAVALQSQFGLSSEQADGMMKLYDDGKLNKENIDKYMEDSKKKGKKKADEDSDNVKDSKENKANKNEVARESQNSRTRENGQWIDDLASAGTSLNNAGYLLTTAAGALLASAAGSAMMGGLSSMIRSLGSKGVGGTIRHAGGKVKGAGGKAKEWGGNVRRGGTDNAGKTSKGGKSTKGGESTKGGTKGGQSDSMRDFKTFDKDSTAGKTKGGRMRGFGKKITDAGRGFGDFIGLGGDTAKNQNGRGLGRGATGNTKRAKFGKGLKDFIFRDPMSKGGAGIVSGGSKVGNVAKGAVGKLGLIGAGINAVDIGSSLAKGDDKSVSSKFGNFMGGIVDPLGLGYGDGLKKHATKTADKAQNNKGLFGKGGLIDFSWSNGDKDGKNKPKDSVLGKPISKAWGGVKSFFSGGDNNEDDKKKDGKKKDGKKKKGQGKGKHVGAFSKASTVPLTSGLGLGLGLGMFSNDDEDKEKEKGDKAKGSKKKKDRMSAERLREKNNTTETKNLSVYRNLLERAEQVLNDAKSLDVGGGDSEGGDSEGGSASDAKGKGKEKIFNFLKDKGLSDDQVSAVMGNLEQESQLDPKAVNPSSGAFGIAQWMGDRKSGLDALAKKKGKKNTDLDVQLDYLWSEMDKGYDADMLKNAGWSKNAGLEKNTEAFASGFERMGVNEAMMGTRVSNAKKYKKQYGKGGSGGGSILGGSGGGVSMASLDNNVSPMVNSSQEGNNSSNTDNRTYNVTVNVNGAGDPQQVAESTASKIESMLQNSNDFFSRQQNKR